VIIGTLIGVLPGLGPVATLAMLLPFTYSLPAGVGADHAVRHLLRRAVRRLDDAILRQPAGESSSVSPVWTATRWRAEAAPARIGIAAIGSFIAGRLCHAADRRFALPLVEVAFKFGPAEYFSLMVLGLIRRGGAGLGQPDQGDRDDRAWPAAWPGRHWNVNSGVARFAFDIPELTDGIGFVAVAMGVFAFAEIITNVEKHEHRESSPTR